MAIKDESKTITCNMPLYPKTPVDLIIKKYRHRISSRLTFERLLEHPKAPLEYLLSNCRQNIRTKYSVHTTKNLPNTRNKCGRWCLSESVCKNPNLPFDLLFKDHLDIIPWNLICENFSNSIDWDALCMNVNFPVKLLSHPECRQRLGIICENEFLDFDRIDDEILLEVHNNLIANSNLGYYIYLIKKEVLYVLNTI
jgi:hypothetical protein